MYKLSTLFLLHYYAICKLLCIITYFFYVSELIPLRHSETNNFFRVQQLGTAYFFALWHLKHGDSSIHLNHLTLCVALLGVRVQNKQEGRVTPALI